MRETTHRSSRRAAPSWRGPSERFRSAVRASWIALVLVAFAAASTGLGCGGGASGADQISKEEFVKEANAVCANTRQRIESEFTAYGGTKEGKEVERARKANELTANEVAAKVAVRILIPAVRQELEELRGLGVPSGDDDRVDELLDALEEGIEKAEARPERAARDGTEAFGKSGRLAREYGLNRC